jgi:hypothetical protein
MLKGLCQNVHFNGECKDNGADNDGDMLGKATELIKVMMKMLLTMEKW